VAKHFENQVTMLVRLSTGQMANCKVFRNGKVQITGLRHIEDGKKFIEFIIAEIKAIATLQQQTGSELQPIVASTCDMQVSQYNVALINTDVRLGFEVKREALYDELRTSCSHLYVTYEPCIYPGVKYLFYWNDMNEHQTGECTCNPLRPNSCKGNGTGSGPRQCKRITIAIFQSGCILVTGGSEYRHIEAAYCYTLKMLASMIHKIKNVVRVDAKLSSLVIEDRYLD
jgi:TATA-box binding protein (TBP) (component of TFIID and TFIIIB)